MANVTRLIVDAGVDPDRPVLEPQPRKAPARAEPPQETVGQTLAKARQRRGEKLSDVWLVLKIRPEHLVAIEEGRWDILPARVYVIGHVRSYAAYLGLDADKIVQRLRIELDGRPPEPEEPARETGSPFNLRPAVTKRVMRLRQLPRLPQLRLPQSGTVITGLLLVAFLYSGYYALASLDRAAEPPVMRVPERLLAEARLAQKAVVDLPPGPLEQRTSLEHRISVQQQAPIEPPEPLLPVPTEVAVTPPAPAPVVYLPEPAPKLQVKLPTGKRYGTRNRNSRITLRAHRPTYVAVKGARNRTFLDRVLWPGDTYRVPNMVGLRFSSPDAGAVELILDGSSMGFVGKDGAPARALSLNPQNVVDRQQRG
jgi:cytoskeleton protein RodZ